MHPFEWRRKKNRDFPKGFRVYRRDFPFDEVGLNPTRSEFERIPLVPSRQLFGRSETVQDRGARAVQPPRGIVPRVARFVSPTLTSRCCKKGQGASTSDASHSRGGAVRTGSPRLRTRTPGFSGNPTGMARRIPMHLFRMSSIVSMHTWSFRFLLGMAADDSRFPPEGKALLPLRTRPRSPLLPGESPPFPEPRCTTRRGSPPLPTDRRPGEKKLPRS